MSTTNCRLQNALRFVIVTLAGLGLCGHALAADVAALLHRLPGSSSLVIASDDIGATCAAFQTTELGKAFAGEKFAPLVAELRKRDQGTPLHLRPWTGFDWPELSAARSPTVVAAFPLKDGSDGIAWLFGEEADKAALQASVKKYFAGKKWVATDVRLEAASLITYSPPGKAKVASYVWWESEGCYGVADSVDAAKLLLTTKAADAFGRLPVAESLLPNAERAHLRFFVQPLALWKSLKAPPPGKELKLKEPVLAAERLGLAGIKHVAGSIRIEAANQGQWRIAAEIAAPPPYPKALKALDLLPGPSVPLPAWIDKDASSVISWRWDFVTGMEGLGHLFDEATDPGPQGEGLFEEVLNGLRDDPEGPRIDVRKELFPKLGPEVMAVRRGKHTLTMIHVAPPNVKAVTDFLVAFYKDDDEVEREALAGLDLWTGKGGAPVFAGAGKPGETSVRAIAIGHGRLWLATDPQWLTDLAPLVAAGKGPEPLNGQSQWIAFADWLESNREKSTALSSFSRPSLGWKEAYDAARIAPQAKVIDRPATRAWSYLLYGTPARSSTSPLAAVPAFSDWGSSLSPTGIIMSQSKVGWRIVAASPPSMGKSEE